MRAFANSIAVLAILVASTRAQLQDPPKDAPKARTVAYAELVAELDAEPMPHMARRQKLLHEFLAAYGADEDSEEVLSAKLRLGTLSLLRLDPLTALETLTEVATRARAKWPALRARALFGLHQASLLQRDRPRAREMLSTILDEHDEDAMAAVAELALAQLDQEAVGKVGQPLPALAFGTDLGERRVDARSFAAGPRVYVFWSIAHEPSQRRLEAIAREWRKLGMPDENLVAYSSDDDVGALRRLAQQRRYAFRILPAGADGFLHPDWLTLQVRAVPTTVLVSGEDVLLAVDLAPARLEAVLRGN